ncbi:hypothetical protein ACLOJK_021988 [Asimina triloba]
MGWKGLVKKLEDDLKEEKVLRGLGDSTTARIPPYPNSEASVSTILKAFGSVKLNIGRLLIWGGDPMRPASWDLP